VSSGATIPARAPASIDMLHTVIRPSMLRARMAEPRYSITWPAPPAVPMVADDGQNDVLGRHPVGKLPVDLHRHGRRPHLGERLGGQDVLHLGGPDPEGEGSEGAVGRGVAVAADHGHARQGQSQLGTDDVHDALVGVAHRIAGDAELGAVGVSTSSCLAETGSATGLSISVVGTLWSAVATVNSG
jgi:hypothetical protein